MQPTEIEAKLKRLQERIPDLPVARILLTRLTLNLGRGMAARLERVIRPFGLAEPEFHVLMMLFSRPEGVANPGELGADASQSAANMSRISDALVKRQLITRMPSVQDRRKWVLRITDQGEELVRRLMPSLFEPLHDMFDGFSDAEQQQLIGQLKRLTAKLSDCDEPGV